MKELNPLEIGILFGIGLVVWFTIAAIWHVWRVRTAYEQGYFDGTEDERMQDGNVTMNQSLSLRISE